MRPLNPYSHATILLVATVALLRSASPAWAQGSVTPSIPNNATGVALTTPMVFTFSAAMDTNQTTAVFYTPQGVVDVTEAWSGSTALTCAPQAASWPAQADIQWMVIGFDAGGNPFPPPIGMTSGLFSTGGGGADTNAPVLVSSDPANNAIRVSLNSPIRLTFNEAMQATHAIAWSANLTEAKFAYSWSADARTLTCDYSENLPTNATITWKLNPSDLTARFKDAAGNELATNVYTGSFTTGCETASGDSSRGSFSVAWRVSYVQTNSASPVEDGDSLPSFSAFLNSPTNNPVTSAQLELPGGSSVGLSNFFVGPFFTIEEYASQAQLDTARPPGAYTLHATRNPGGSVSLTLNHQAGDWPPTPEILNLPALQTAATNSDVIVRWNGFANAGEGDSIAFTLTLGGDLVYQAPDPCVPIVLDKTATSITLPAGLLVAGRTYDANLSYLHFGPFDTNSIPDIVAWVGASKDLSFTIVTGGGGTQPKSPTIGSPTLTGSELQFPVTGAAPGQSLELQEASVLGSWATIRTVQADGSGTTTFTVPAAAAGARFYRLYTP